MNSVRVKSYAKINLTLDILGAVSGYHMIDSVVASIDLCDVITVKKRKDGLVSIAMHGEGSEAIAHENNNAALAAEEFVKRFETCGADITVWKNIPMGAGLGGSSADVAGVLNGMAKLYGAGGYSQLKEIADGLGSDCGYMLTGGFARLTGRGERVERLGSNLKLQIGLLLPKCGGVSTAECYALFDKLGSRLAPSSANAAEAVVRENREELGKSLSNFLIDPAICLNESIAGCIGELKAFDPLGVNMTGSGSGVYAIFENEEFLRYAKSRYRGKNTFITTKTVLPFKEE